MIKTKLTEWFDLKHPIIMAPMFLVTNVKMLKSAYQNGIIGCIPALNFKKPELLEKAIDELKKEKIKFGINLIVNKSNIYFQEHLDLCIKYKVDFIITSLGSPETVIKRSKEVGIKVFCDVTDLEYATKVEKMGADAIIAVNSGAGGHLGKLSSTVLIPMLKANCKIPIIAAGGVGDSLGFVSMLCLGAEGVSIGSPFIATVESDISEPYKEACIKYGAEDIVVTTKLSGTPCTVINTDYVKKIGTSQNLIEQYLNKNKNLKRFAKMLTFYRGMKLLEKAAFSATYQSVWCAGQSIEFTEKKETINEVIERLTQNNEEIIQSLYSKINK